MSQIFSRIFRYHGRVPEGTGQSIRGLDFYDQLIDALLEISILYNFISRSLTERVWLNPDISDGRLRCFFLSVLRVGGSINEPQIVIGLGYYQETSTGLQTHLKALSWRAVRLWKCVR